MIRQITYTIGEDMQLTPTAIQDAGVQGEHNATQIGFTLPATLRTGYKLYLEALDGRGGYDRTSELTLTDGAVYTCLPREWTQAGGELTLRLVAKAVAADGTVTETVYTFEVRLRLRDRNIPENGVTPLLEQELQNAIAAGEQAKQAATTATEKAATATEKAKAAADSATAATKKAELAGDKAETATGKAAAAAASAKAAAASAATATEKAEKANALPLEPAGTEKKSVQSRGHSNRISGRISGSAAFGSGNVAEGDGHDWQLATGWQNRSRGNNILNAGSRNTAQGHNSVNLGQDNEARDYNGHNIGFQNVAAARQTENIGTGLLTDTPEQVAVGTTNAPNPDAVLMIGNGTVHRSNAMTVRRDGKITVGGHFEDSLFKNPGNPFFEKSIGSAGKEYDLNNDTNKITGSGAITAGGVSREAALVVSENAAGGTRPQMLINKIDRVPWHVDDFVQITAGKGYRVRFYVLAKTPGSFQFRYWLTADSSTTCYTATAQKNAAVIYEEEGIPVSSNAWTRVECTIPAAAHGGLLRLGVAGYIDSANQSTEFYLSDIAISYLVDVPTYRVADGGGSAYSGTLFKIAELQTAGNQNEWLIGREVQIQHGTVIYMGIIITASDVSAGKLGDGNTYYAKDGQIKLLCVDRIGTDKNGAPCRGIYAADDVVGVGYKKWVDAPPVDVSAVTFSNALRGKKRGGTVRIDDAAPVQHELALQVKSKNLIPQPYDFTTKTASGVTFTANEDGSIVVNGTAEADTGIRLVENLPLQIGTTYTLSGCPSGDNRLFMSGATYSGSVYDVGNGATFTATGAPDSDGYRVNFILTAGKVYNNVVFKPQIEEGDTATAYAKAVAPAAVTVRRNGKNLIPYPYWNGTKTINDVTFTVGDDGTVTANGTATANIYFVLQRHIPLQLGTTYTLSGAPAGSSNLTYYLYAANQDVSDWAAGNILNQTSAATFTPIKSPGQYGFGVSLVIRSGTVCNNVVFRPQIEVGDVTTAYEPYIPPEEYTPAADGTVAGVLTLDPVTTLTTDSAGAVLEAEYSRDVNKAFAALQAAVEALQS